MIDVTGLNNNQKDAVLADDRYLRIIAGAGSGKTRVLTMRVAHLVLDEGIPARQILAITFTNKAANEMKERIRKMMDSETSVPWISTIHSLCVRILREDIQCMGWPRNFTVMDAEDQKTVLREAYKIFNVDGNTITMNSILDYIANNKSADITVERAYEIAGTFSGEKIKAKFYEYYVNRQKALYALDFDDLILVTVKMFKTYREVLNKWNGRFHYIHVDEFQDIDKVQYKLITLLAGNENSLYVVGDPDQTIYTWRGADVNIIMNYEKDFKPCRTIVLNENYRSTDCILNGANSVIKNNQHRVEKDLFTSRQSKEKITHYSSAGDEYEAAWIAAKIKELHQNGKSYKDMAILYRSNYLSRSIEKGLLDERIPYVIYGGVRFFERQEVKDALCYLRMISIADDLAFQRVINRPKRGVGNKTMDTISARARETGQSMYEVIRSEKLFSGRMQQTMDSFVALIERYKKIAAEGNTEIYRMFEHIMEESGYKGMLTENKELERIENIKELTDDIKEFSENYPESTLDEYLQLVSLYGDRDETMNSDYVQLMTVHAAKGLEFDTVFISDMSDGIFPNERAMADGHKGIEEERRLAYVAFTRAKNKLFITDAGGFSYILQRVRTVSRFVNEIDPDFIEHIGAVERTEKRDFGSASFSAGSSRSNIQFDLNEKPISDQLMGTAAQRFTKGEQVIHSKFGEGIILSCKAGIAEIAFPYPYGVKKIAAGHPTLKKKSEMKN